MSPREKYEAEVIEFSKVAAPQKPTYSGLGNASFCEGGYEIGGRWHPQNAVRLARWLLRMEGVAFGCEHYNATYHEKNERGSNTKAWCPDCGAFMETDAQGWTLPRWMESEKP